MFNQGLFMSIAPGSSPRWQRYFQPLLGLLIAESCALCQRRANEVFCAACQRQMRQTQFSHPLYSHQNSLPVVSWGRYEDSLRQMIRQLKYSGQPQLAQWLGVEMGRTWRQHRPASPAARPIAIVPIPLHASKLQQRGFNQAELLARWVSRAAQAPLVGDGLVRWQATQAQHGLSAQQRHQNLAQAFAVNPRHLAQLRGKTVWLVDDIFTTGATAQAAVQALRQEGISVAGICTAARSELRPDAPPPI